LCSLLKTCMEPPKPLEVPDSFPHNSAKILFGSTPMAIGQMWQRYAVMTLSFPFCMACKNPAGKASCPLYKCKNPLIFCFRYKDRHLSSNLLQKFISLYHWR